MPHVSVIVPTYNRATYLTRAVDSVLAQTYRDLEVIIVDDGSEDDTRRVVERYGGRVRYVFQDNAGPGAARNHGIRISTGAYLAFLDSDDMWMPDFLEKTVSALDAHPRVDVASTGIYIGPRERRQVALLDGAKSGEWRLPTGCVRGQVASLFHCCWSGAVVSRREVIEKYGGFYEHGCLLGEDVYLWIQVLLNHRIYRIAEPLAWYDTTASGLGFASERRHYPLEPVLTDPEPIWRHCPPEYREYLSSWMTAHAVSSIHVQIEAGDYDNVRWLTEHYPAVREWRWDWLKIRFKLAFPSAANLLKGAKRALQGRRAGDRRQAGRAGAGLQTSPVFSVVTCVSDQDLLHRALESSLKEVHGAPVEVIAIDNSDNRYSAPQALNLGAAQARGEVLVFLHQDVRLPPAWLTRLAEQIRLVEESFGTWGVLGVFGVTSWGQMVGHIDDPHGYRRWGHLPCRVQSLDEVCLIVRRDSGLRFDEQLGGFHFYGADLCLQARQRGASCYVIDACLEHLSGGRKDARFWEMARRFEAKWRNVPGSPATIVTTCGIFRTQGGAEAICIKAISGLGQKVWDRFQRPAGTGCGGGRP